MGKFRSKLKRHVKGKSWSRGHSSTTNPENMKHRMKAKSRFFQPNLSLAPVADPTKKNSLTFDALIKHDARQEYARGKEPTVDEVAGSLKSVNIDDDIMSGSNLETFKTYQTFASSYSACTNQSFNKLLRTFRADSETHKEMLAILSALTEIIKERGGKETYTEYYLLLMETIDTTKVTSQLSASISLLAMGIGTVPVSILRKSFSSTLETLLVSLELFLETNNQHCVRNIIKILSIVLRAQHLSAWYDSSTTKCIDMLLFLMLHTRPKIRRSAHNAIVAIINGSSFMSENEDSNKNAEDEAFKKKFTEIGASTSTSTNQNADEEQRSMKIHPASKRIMKFCVDQLNSLSAKSNKTVLHSLELLKDIVNCFSSQQIRVICENLLSVMTSANIMIRAKGFEVLYRLFVSRNENLTGDLCGKLIFAIYDYRPDKENVSETLRWITVLREGYIHLATVNLSLCMEFLPHLFNICIRDLLPTQGQAATTLTTLKTIFDMCVKPACETEELTQIHQTSILKLIKLTSKGLSTCSLDTEYMKYITLICSKLFEAVGKYFSNDLEDILVTLGKQYGTQSPYRIPIEHAILSAIKFMGPESTLKAIPITDPKGSVYLERSWLLPLLREGITETSIEFFVNHILKLATDCYEKWHKLKEDQNILWHSYELLCCQLWGLFPSCCRKVKDIENFRLVAKKLGTALNNNPEFRAPILDGFKELINNDCEKCNNELRRYAKNILPCLFNIYATKPNGTYEMDIRKKTLEVIKEYLNVTPKEVYVELFQTATEQLTSKTDAFTKDAIFDIISLIVVLHESKELKKFYVNFMVPILKNNKNKLFITDEQQIQKLQRKTYNVLEQILSKKEGECARFVKKNFASIQDLLLESFFSSCSICQASRLKCLKLLIENKDNLATDDKVIIKTIPELLINFKNFSSKKENIALELLTMIGNKFKEANKLEEFIDIIMAGLAGDQILITNTILALRTVVQTLSGSLTISTLQFILDQILVLLVQKDRAHAEASVKFLITFVKVLPSPLVANHLDVIIRSLSTMVPDTKRYCRLLIGYILKKLCKRFGAEECIKLVPGNDEVTHRKLKKIRKDLNRETRRKLDHSGDDDKDDDDDDEEEILAGMEAKSMTIDDILEDSDSDLTEDGEMNESSKNVNKKTKGKELYIQEFPEDIVDLQDIKSVGNVMTSFPKGVTAFNKASVLKKKKDPNRGFKTSEDGRLIVTLNDKDDESESDEDESTVNEPDNVDVKEKKSKRKFDEDSSDDNDENIKAPSRKRKAIDSKSVTSKKSTISQYKPGGKGIHRPVAASVKSGYSNVSRKSAKSAATTKSEGAEYSSRKARGDIKKTGKPDPYAYIPLSRNILNKRKRAKHAGQFRSIVKGVRKGIAKGSKSKAHKVHRK